MKTLSILLTVIALTFTTALPANAGGRYVAPPHHHRYEHRNDRHHHGHDHRHDHHRASRDNHRHHNHGPRRGETVRDRHDGGHGHHNHGSHRSGHRGR